MNHCPIGQKGLISKGTQQKRRRPMALFIRHNPGQNNFEIVQKIPGIELEVIVETEKNKEVCLKKYQQHIDAYNSKPDPNLLKLQHLPKSPESDISDKGNNDEE